MDLKRLNKRSLYEIAISPREDMSKRYEAARELQRMRLNGDVLTNVVRLYPFLTPVEIAERINVAVEAVNGIAAKYGLVKGW